MTRSVHPCQCARCQMDAPHPDREYHRQMNLLLSRLDERQRRWYLASNRSGWGMAPIACCSRSRVWTRRPSAAGVRN
jgi:hypothetical protein